ncbi:hypothetical protein, partial [Skermania piniformis]|uniref:hypothetical protein n=1 Tax=Skermania pinensis TaxID=39122 RepID=UPI0039ECDAE9
GRDRPVRRGGGCRRSSVNGSGRCVGAYRTPSSVVRRRGGGWYGGFPRGGGFRRGGAGGS